MTFLGKIQRIEAREEDSIEVYRQQIIEIFLILGCERIGGPIRTGKGVHEGVERASQHHKKGIAHRVFFATTQNRMLENMGHPRGVLRYRSQGYHEDIFVRVCIHM